MPHHKIALFGEAEKGTFCSPLVFSKLVPLEETLGNPPEGSMGLHLAIQALMLQKEVVYIRVQEEGFSISDYEKGLYLLQKQPLAALGMPGMGHQEILHQAFDLCRLHNAFLMISQKDFYDYITTFCSESPYGL